MALKTVEAPKTAPVARKSFSRLLVEAWSGVDYANYREALSLLKRAMRDNTSDGTTALFGLSERFSALTPEHQDHLIRYAGKELSKVASDPYYDTKSALIALVAAEFFSRIPGDVRNHYSIRETDVVGSLVSVTRSNHAYRASDREKVNHACATALSKLGYTNVEFWVERLNDNGTRSLAIHELLGLNNGHSNETEAIEFIVELSNNGNSTNVSASRWPGIVGFAAHFAYKTDEAGFKAKNTLVTLAQKGRPGAEKALSEVIDSSRNTSMLADERQFVGIVNLIALHNAGAPGLRSDMESLCEDMADLLKEPTGTGEAQAAQKHNASVILGLLARAGFTPNIDSGVLVTVDGGMVSVGIAVEL